MEFAGGARCRIEKTLSVYASRDVAELAGDSAALNVGRNLFLNNCATCHGSDGGGAPGFPNLTDEDWLWGGAPETVLATISNGRAGMMPPWGDALGAAGVEDMLAYVYSLQGRELPAGNKAAGEKKFGELCVACHGADARGKIEMGTPNLTDGVWLHGGALTSVRDSIAHGRTGTMPAHLERLGETRVKLLAAYVLSLGKTDAPKVLADAHPAQ